MSILDSTDIAQAFLAVDENEKGLINRLDVSARGAISQEAAKMATVARSAPAELAFRMFLAGYWVALEEMRREYAERRAKQESGCKGDPPVPVVH